MTLGDNPGLRLVEPEAGRAVSAPQPKVFVRTLTAPAGAPWDQARVADLEARMGAPLPIEGLSYRLRRLEPWRPGRTARFAAFYVRRSEVGSGLRTTVTVEGAPQAVTFLSPGDQRRRAQGALALAAGAAVSALLIFTGVSTALAKRAAGETELASLEGQFARKLAAARATSRLKQQALALRAVSEETRTAPQAAADLEWLATHKAPGARLEAVHWQNGAMAVEARGAAAPLAGSERPVTKSPRPIRRGVWLWGVGPAPQQVAAGLR